jgi:hypothetical protein
MGLGFGIRNPEKTYSGSRIQVSKRHQAPDAGCRIRNTATKYVKGLRNHKRTGLIVITLNKPCLFFIFILNF